MDDYICCCYDWGSYYIFFLTLTEYAFHCFVCLLCGSVLLGSTEQSRANPVLVPRGLPTAQDYQEAMKTWLEGASLMVAPAQTRDEEEKDGYLAVLEKV